MLSSVLRSEKAIDTNIAIMRAFIAIRSYSLRFNELAAKVMEHDKALADINEVLRWLGEENQARHDEIQALLQGIVWHSVFGNPSFVSYKSACHGQS